MATFNAVSLGVSGFSPVHSGPAFFNGSSGSSNLHGIQLSRYNAENVPVIQTYSSHAMASQSSRQFLGSVSPIESFQEPAFYGVMPQSSLSSRQPVMSATLGNNWGWDQNEYTQGHQDIPDSITVSVSTPQQRPVEVNRQVPSSYPSLGAMGHALSAGNMNDLSWSSYVPHMNSFEQRAPVQQAPQRGAFGATDLMNQIRRETAAESVQTQPRESWGAGDLMRQMQREAQAAQTPVIASQHYAPAQYNAQSGRSYSVQNGVQTSSNNTGGTINRTSSFARDFYVNSQNVSGQYHRRVQSTGSMHRQYTIDGRVTCQVNLNNEAEGLLSVLRRSPRRELYIQYNNSAGMDSGGLTRQAFDGAYKQLINKENGFFQKVDGEYKLNPQATSADARDLGIILGRIAKMQGSGVGQDLGEDFFKNVYGALQSIGQHTGDVNQFIQHASTSQLQNIMLTFDSETYGSPAARDYLMSMDHEDVAELVKDNASQFLALAAGFKSTQPQVASSYEHLMEQVCGHSDLRGALLDTTHYVADGAFSMSEMPTRKRDHLYKIFSFATKLFPSPRVTPEKQIETWFKRAINEASDEELKNMSRNFTGGSTFNPQVNPVTINIRTNSGEDSQALFNAHTCFNSVDVNACVMMSMIRSKQFDNFKAVIFDGATQGFNRS